MDFSTIGSGGIIAIIIAVVAFLFKKFFGGDSKTRNEVTKVKEDNIKEDIKNNTIDQKEIKEQLDEADEIIKDSLKKIEEIKEESNKKIKKEKQEKSIKKTAKEIDKKWEDI